MARRFNVKPIKRSKKALNKMKDKLPTTGPEEEPVSPRITNDTVAEHREEVLSGGRRFLYPLQHSKHKVVIISVGLISVLMIATLVLSYLMLYRWQSTSNFAYRVTEILPVPVAKVGNTWIPYDKYLFEVRYSIFYNTNHAQEGIDINTSDGQKIISQAKIDALEKAKLDVLAAKIAKENNITVSAEEIQQQIDVFRQRGGLDDSPGALEDVLRDFYGWNLNDLESVVRAQLIRQKIPASLDSETNDSANKALEELKAGAKFEDLVSKYSQDNFSKDKNGSIGVLTRDSQNWPRELIDAAFALEEGQTSTELVRTPFGVHIIRVDKKSADEVEVSHVFFRYFNVNDYLKTKLQEQNSTDYIKL
jgi:hypothetical protein